MGHLSYSHYSNVRLMGETCVGAAMGDVSLDGVDGDGGGGVMEWEEFEYFGTRL